MTLCLQCRSSMEGLTGPKHSTPVILRHLRPHNRRGSANHIHQQATSDTRQNNFDRHNCTDTDKSGILHFPTNELLVAEAADQRVWIIGHVISGGSSAIVCPSALARCIAARVSPTTIAGIFFGHTYGDEKELSYEFKPQTLSSTVERNYTADVDYDSPAAVAFIRPLIVPLADYNASWSLYHIDRTEFSVVNGRYIWLTPPVHDHGIWSQCGNLSTVAGRSMI